MTGSSRSGVRTRSSLLLLLAERLDLALLDEACARMAVAQERDLHVGHDVEQEEAAALLAVLGEEGHAGVHRHAGIPDRDLFAVDRDRARGRGRDAEQRLGDIAAARADEAGEAENLALAQIEGDVAKAAFAA